MAPQKYRWEAIMLADPLAKALAKDPLPLCKEHAKNGVVSYKSSLLEKFRSKDATIAVVGLGYVGLPLATELANVGFRVIGIDVNKLKIQSLLSGISYVTDVPNEVVAKLVAQGKLIPSDTYDLAKQAEAVVVCVPTPLSKTRDPDVSYILKAMEGLRDHLSPGRLIILESTTYPGFTRDVLATMIETLGLRVGKDVFLAFSPERIDPGNKKFHIKNTPKVVGGTTPDCTEVAVALYQTIVDQVVPVSSPDVAEMVKLLENTFRAVNIALANEFAVICDRLGLNVWEVISAAATKPFGFMAFYPGPGLGGHCIPVDPQFLAWRMRGVDYRTRFIDLATEINLSMPRYVVDKVILALNDEGRPLKASRILVIGVAYKQDVSDTRESPAATIISLLERGGAVVDFYDPYVAQFEVDGQLLTSLPALTAETLSQTDCVLIVTAHSKVDYRLVVEHARLVVDARNATKGLCGKAKIVTL